MPNLAYDLKKVKKTYYFKPAFKYILYIISYIMPTDPKQFNGVAASATRLSGKTASDAFKNHNNSGMLFKKEAKAATNIGEYRSSLERLRMKESSSKDNGLRKYTN
jgi:hypothetical protein